MLPVPDVSEKAVWDERIPGPPTLQLGEMQKLRQAIRSERRERRDDRIAWVNPAVAISGVLFGVGATIVAVLT